MSSNILARGFFLTVLVVCLLYATACTSEHAPAGASSSVSKGPSSLSSAANTGGRSLSILPKDPNRKTTLSLVPTGFALRDARITWYVDDSVVLSSGADTFTCADIPKGARVRVEAAVSGIEVRSQDVVMRNTPPDLADVVLTPGSSADGDTLSVTAAVSDIDGDAVTVQYTWTVNGSLAGNGPKLQQGVRRGDAVQVKAIANDGQVYSEAVIVNHVVANQPPTFREQLDYSFDGNTYVYQAQATDPDGDRISYGLEDAPEGMTIAAGSGKVTWNVPAGFRGDQPVTIVADDGHGGSARYPVTFTIKE